MKDLSSVYNISASVLSCSTCLWVSKVGEIIELFGTTKFKHAITEATIRVFTSVLLCCKNKSNLPWICEKVCLFVVRICCLTKTIFVDKVWDFQAVYVYEYYFLI